MSTTRSDVMLPGRQLLPLTAAAIAVATVVFVVAVLPAEFGRDPTGVGQRLGLTQLAAETGGEADGATAHSAPAAPVQVTASSFEPAEHTVRLEPGQGVEVKARMRAGDTLLYDWAVDGGVVHVDMHGERIGAAEDEYTSYRRGKHQPSDHGVFTAPFDGTHGWYWKNMHPHPVSVSVRISGHFEDFFIKQ